MTVLEPTGWAPQGQKFHWMLILHKTQTVPGVAWRSCFREKEHAHKYFDLEQQWKIAKPETAKKNWNSQKQGVFLTPGTNIPFKISCPNLPRPQHPHLPHSSSHEIFYLTHSLFNIFLVDLITSVTILTFWYLCFWGKTFVRSIVYLRTRKGASLVVLG